MDLDLPHGMECPVRFARRGLSVVCAAALRMPPKRFHVTPFFLLAPSSIVCVRVHLFLRDHLCAAAGFTCAIECTHLSMTAFAAGPYRKRVLGKVSSNARCLLEFLFSYQPKFVFLVRSLPAFPPPD